MTQQLDLNVDRDRIWAALEALSDPEIPVLTLREMGILREVRPGRHGWDIVITPTYSGCPAMGQIEDDIRSALLAQGIEAKVLVQLAPAWTTDWMNEQAKAKLRDYGIAPPAGPAPSGGVSILRLSSRTPEHDVACPRCSSANTTEISHFGSTACKALFRCLDCMEPFDHFKPH